MRGPLLGAGLVTWLAAAPPVQGGEAAVSAEVTVALPPERCWEKLSDLSVAHRYVPGIERTEITTPRSRGVGASRTVYDAKDRGLDETVVEWDEGGGLVLRLHRGDAGPPAPFARAWFRYRLEDAGASATRAVLTLGYEPRWGPFGRALDAVLMRRLVRRRIETVAERMKRFWELEP